MRGFVHGGLCLRLLAPAPTRFLVSNVQSHFGQFVDLQLQKENLLLNDQLSSSRTEEG
jgi:hypothetical protein